MVKRKYISALSPTELTSRRYSARKPGPVAANDDVTIRARYHENNLYTNSCICISILPVYSSKTQNTNTDIRDIVVSFLDAIFLYFDQGHDSELAVISDIVFPWSHLYIDACDNVTPIIRLPTVILIYCVTHLYLSKPVQNITFIDEYTHLTTQCSARALIRSNCNF
jgi:hypothetical protein